MTGFLRRLKQRKIVQWAIAYVAFGFALIQVIDVVADSYDWPHLVMHLVFGVLVVGFVVMLLLAWYHGERGAQRISGPELLLIALALAIGGGLLWHFGREGPPAAPAKVAAATRTGVSQHVAATKGSKAVSTSSSATASKAAVATIAARPIPAKSIAVLPFENLSADKNNAYFADGMQDVILTKLADIDDLKVIARSSTEAYGSHPRSLSTVGEQLGVATVLEGSVQKAGNQVLINVQLIDARTDSHLWAQTYQRTLSNVFGVEGEVAGKVATALNAKLTTAESARVARVLTTNPQAYTLYLKARHDMDAYMASVSIDQMSRLARDSISQLERAVALDPGFASAYANLAVSELLLLRVSGSARESVVLPRMEANARKALSLQSDLAGGHLALGMTYGRKSDFTNALRELQTAAHLAPSDPFVVRVLAIICRAVGKEQQAYDATHKAVLLDPRNGANYDTAADVSVRLRRYADARQMLEQGLAVSPDNMPLRSSMGGLLVVMGQPADARISFAQLPDSDVGKFGGLAYAWALSRNYAQALKAARQILPSKYVGATGFRALLIGHYARMVGDKADADTAMAQARAEIEAALQRIAQSKSRHVAGYEPELYYRLARIEAESGHRDAALHDIAKATAWVAALGKRRSGRNLLHTIPDYFELKAEVLALFGDAKGATDILRRIFDTQGTGWVISVPLLKLDPVWDPIRHDPRFQELLKKYTKYKPAVIPVAPSSSEDARTSATANGAGHA